MAADPVLSWVSPAGPGPAGARAGAGASPAPRSFRALRFWCFRWSRTWRASLAANFVYPTVYLAAMGIGLGQLVNHHLALSSSGAVIGGVNYLTFVAPGILAASVMQIGVHEATYPVMGAIRWDYAYLGQLASPLGVSDVLRGHLGFLCVRALMAAAVFVAIAEGFGALRSPEAILAVPVAVLVALAFGSVVAAFSVTRENDASFSTIQRLGVVPLFLFSGSFFPISQLPAGLRVLAVCTPLYHGVALERACTLGALWSWPNLGHLAYLVALTALGFCWARVTYRRRLAA